MTARKLAYWFAAAIAIAVPRPAAWGQAVDAFSDPGVYHDMQWFAPVEFDFDDLPVERDAGYIVRLEKLSWATTGERIGVGAPVGNNAVMSPFRLFDDGGQLIPNPDPDADDEVIFVPGEIVELIPPVMLRDLNDVAPDADFAWGERYEIGIFSGDNSWVIGILAGPESNTGGSFGFALTGQDETLGPFPGWNPLFGQLASPLGSVYIPFEDPLLLMRGYLDVWDGLVEEGPPGDVLESDSNGDGILDGDGIADDIDRDGHYGPDGLDVEDPGEVPDVLGGALPPDLGDLVLLPTSWQFVDVRNSTKTNGVEIMKSYRMKNRHMMAKHQNNDITISGGVRFLQLDDQFRVSAEGGVLGLSFWDTQVVNNLVGPQVALNWHHQRRRVGLDFNGRFMFAYNISNFDQTAALGEDLIASQHNHPLYFVPQYNVHGKQENEFSPTVELRTQASYQLTQAIALKLGYTAIFVDNISRASAQVRYTLPDMGFVDEAAGEQEIFINGVDFGLEAVF